MSPDRLLRRGYVTLAVGVATARMLLAPDYLDRALYQILIPAEDGFFPEVLKDPLLLLSAVLLPVPIQGAAIWLRTREAMRFAAVVELVSATILLVHQASFYTATWVVMFWCAWVMVWIAWSGSRRPERVITTGPLLAQAVVAFIFLGGAIGKWTAGYWAGDPMFDIFFRRHLGAVYEYLRLTVDEATLRTIAMFYSRMIVVTETAMIGVVFLPPRGAAVATMMVGLGLWLSSADLYEIVLPLMGLAGAMWTMSGGPLTAADLTAPAATVQPAAFSPHQDV